VGGAAAPPARIRERAAAMRAAVSVGSAGTNRTPVCRPATKFRSASANATAEGKRSGRSWDIALSVICSSASGSSGRIDRSGGGGSLMIFTSSML